MTSTAALKDALVGALEWYYATHEAAVEREDMPTWVGYAEEMLSDDQAELNQLIEGRYEWWDEWNHSSPPRDEWVGVEI